MPTIILYSEDIHCSSCKKTIETYFQNISDIESAHVNVIAKSIKIDYNSISIEQIVDLLFSLGYKANTQSRSHSTLDRTMLIKSISAGILGLIVMFFSMSQTLPPLGSSQGKIIWLIISLITLIIMLYSGSHFFIKTFKSLRFGNVTMDTLIVLSTSIGWIYSTFVVIHPGFFTQSHLYFETSLIIIALVNIGKTIEAKATKKTLNALSKLVAISPKKALRIRGTLEELIPIEQIKENDLLRVKPGETIALDGIVIEGSSSTNEAVITGESQPIKKEKKSHVIGGTSNLQGSFIMQVLKTYDKTLLSQIIELVEKAQNSKPPIASIADKISSIFVPSVCLISLLTALIWFFSGGSSSEIITTAMTVLIVSCPCALGLATPLSMTIGLGKAAKSGALIKDGKVLQSAATITHIAFDKTGTITKGYVEVVDLITEKNKEEILSTAVSLERLSEHPLGKAVVTFAKDIKTFKVDDFKNIPGYGVTATFKSKKVAIGNIKLMNELNITPQTTDFAVNTTPLFMAIDKTHVATFLLADPLRDNLMTVISQLKSMGYHLSLLTGDIKKVAESIKKEIPFDQVLYELLPQEKVDAINAIQSEGHKIAMVGDGINDAPALSAATVSIALGSGSDIAIESSDVTLMNNSLFSIVETLKISKATLRNIKQNLVGAFIYNILAIPIAAGILFPITGMLFSPMIGAVVMSLSSITVVLNATRLFLRRNP